MCVYLCVCTYRYIRWCHTLPHTATNCNTLQHTITWQNGNRWRGQTPLWTEQSVLRFDNSATHCNTLQHTATHCNTLQHTATHCNTLQHTATHCNTLQHTATNCAVVWRWYAGGGGLGGMIAPMLTMSKWHLLPTDVCLFMGVIVIVAEDVAAAVIVTVTVAGGMCLLVWVSGCVVFKCVCVCVYASAAIEKDLTHTCVYVCIC